MQPANNKTKIIASVLVIMVVAALAIVTTMTAKDDGQTAEVDTSQATEAENPTDSTSATSQDSASSANTQNATYKDGTYTVSETYISPGGQEQLDVSLTVTGGVITAASVHQEANNRDSQEHQSAFANAYKSKVVGKSLQTLNLSRISGASLTTESFNDALNEIRSQAQA